MHLKKTLIIALVIALAGLSSWEMFWRSKGYYPTLNDEKALWAIERSKVEKTSSDDVVIIGSSRSYFDIQIETWKQETGKYPIQLSSTGSSPLPTFHDLVNNTNFIGTIIIGVTPGLFFSTTYPGAFPWQRPQSKVDFYQDRTYAQRLNFRLSVPLQQNFVFMSADEEEWADDLDLKSLLRQITMGNRPGSPIQPPFYNFGDVSIPRNMSMSNRAATDTSFANTIIKVWHWFGKGAPPPEKEPTMIFFMKDYNKFTKRGGKVILLRCPSSGGDRIGENMGLPRADFWDYLVKQTGAKSYHFEDYAQLKNLTCPEESHLSKKDAEYFTTEIANIMMKDGVITNFKTN